MRRLKKLMPELLNEMRNDLSGSPLSREIVLMNKSWAFWGKGDELFYYYDQHPDLDNKFRILNNFGLVYDITSGYTKKYVIMEEFADYLTV